MDRRFLTVLGLALIFALVVSTIFYYQVAGRSASASPAPTNLTDIVVATKPLPVGVTIKPDDVKLAKVTTDQFPKGAFSKVEEVLDRPVISNVLLDEPVFEGRLAARGSGLGLAPIIPVGMRAVSVRVTDVAGVAGFVLPGLRVDVQVTGQLPGNSGGNMTSTCLQNILVLSAGQTIQPDGRGQAIQTPTVTLLVTPEQAEILTLAGNEGRLQLVLRNSSDQEIAKTPGAGMGQLYGKPRALVAERVPRPRAAAAPIAAPPPPPPPPEVVVIRGNTRTVEVVASKTN